MFLPDKKNKYLIFLWPAIFFLMVVQAQAGDLPNESDVPVILPRSIWDNSLSLHNLMTWAPQKTVEPYDWQPVERIILHDTGCDTAVPTCNNNQNPVATIQAIYRYHAVTQGWGDIGYNYIIDQQGRIYEGRVGGNGSRGAHVYRSRTRDNFNYGSVGISILGNYGAVAPPAAAVESAIKLVAWLCAANNLDPLAIRSSLVWNTEAAIFRMPFTGAVVLGHKDLETGNPDPGLLDLAKLRLDAAVYANIYKNYIYQVDGLGKIYKLEKGARQTFNDVSVFTASGDKYAKLVSVSQSQIDLFSETRYLKYPDGSLLQIMGEPVIYLIDGGQKRNFDVSAKQFIKLGFDFKNVRQATSDELANFPPGAAIKYGPDKTLINDGAKTYFIDNGKRHWVTSEKLFTILGYKRAQVKQMSSSEVASFLEGEFMSYPDGTLVRQSNNPTIYLIKGAQKHEFLSEQSFNKLGYKQNKVLIIEPSELALYPAGYFMAYKDGTLVKSASAPNVFLVDKGKIRIFLSGEIFNNLKYKSSQVLTIASDELARYLPGDPVGYKAGTLLRPNDRNDVYLISGNKAQAIDAATFKKRKYRWANVLVVATQDFGILYEGKSGPPIIVQSSPMPNSTTTPSVQPSVTPVPAPASSPPPSALPISAAPKIRIAIYEVLSPSVTLTANTAFNVLDRTGQILTTKAASENYVYNIVATSSAFVKIAPQPANGIVQIVSYEDHPIWRPTLNYNQFRGTVEIIYSVKSNKVWAVNELDLEDYLKGIAEIAEGETAEYQKAMIIAARTYAEYYIQKGGKRGVDEVYILNNTSSDQLYKGYSREILTPSIVEAVDNTRGEIVIYNGQPIVAAYSSGAAELITSGTKSACVVWGAKFCAAEFAYLNGGVKDSAGTEYAQLSCGGANHCVGLSGAGARAFAKAGTKNYQEILEYYYLGTEIKKIY